jgi:uncharacterized hydrophobic protein (TIGR00341 family)
MALRLIEIVLPKEKKEEVQEVLKEKSLEGFWSEKISENMILTRILLDSSETEGILELLEKRFSMVEGFRIILFSVEASIPRPKPVDKVPSKTEYAKPNQKTEKKSHRISQEELYSDISDRIELSAVYIVMVFLSSIVAAVGILNSNVAVVIGAMVIAPLLGPNVALSLGTTLGDIKLVRRALKTNMSGIFVAFIFSLFVGIVVRVNPDIPEILSRTKVGLGDIALALASGSAGALAFTTGVPTALIGVMVAVALLPPLVTFGLLLGSGNWIMALGAVLLFFINLICVNLAGVVTFVIQGFRPKTWWEADKARKSTHIAIALWVLLLVILVILILLSKG